MTPPRTLARLFGAATALLLLGAARPAPEYTIDAIRYGTVRDFRVAGLVMGADPAERMDIAMVFWLVRGDGRVILVDSGFHRPGWFRSFEFSDYLRPDSALLQAGVQAADVTDLVLTHAHWDHMGGIDLFPNATVHIQRSEYEYYTGPAWREGGRHGGIDEADIAELVRRNMAGQVALVDGDDQEILPGIRAYTGARHTYASQYLLVEGSEPYVLASDNCYLFRNLETHTAGATFLPEDRAANEAALERMARLAGSPARVVPGHDPLQFERFPTRGRIARIHAPAEYDLVIRNGRVLDGAGNPWIPADVAIRDGRFARVGVVEGRGAREIDAAGKYVSPGWIDMMDQSGAALLRNPLAENKLRMGVTTAIAGEGGTPALPAMPGGERRGATTANIPAFFQALEDSAISVNFGTYYSEAQARTAVLGNSAREPTAPELDRMRAAMDSAMRAGVLGMTTALIYPPGSYATTQELAAVAQAMAPYGGIYASHVRGEGKELVQSIGEAIRIGEQAGVPVEIFHFKAAYQPGWGTLMREAIDTINAARARGVDVAADLYPYTAGGTGLEATIPSWAFEGGQDSLRARLADPTTRALLRKQVETGVEGWWNIIEASGGWQNVVLAGARNPQYARFQGQSIERIAEQLGKDPIDAAWDIALAGDGRVSAIYHMMSEGDIATALGQPWVSIGSDAGAVLRPGAQSDGALPHPRTYGNHPRVIKRFVKELGALTLPDAIRRMTSWPATRMRLTDRGLIREGLWADVVVFDLDAIDDRATYEQPIAEPAGIEYVLVNGVVTIDQGRHTGARAGRVLYGAGRSAGTSGS